LKSNRKKNRLKENPKPWKKKKVNHSEEVEVVEVVINKKMNVLVVEA
jgi:hypothetical protein